MFSTLDSRGKTREQPDEIRVWHARNQLRQPKNENSNAKTCWTLENECPANPPEDARQEPGVKRGSAAASCSPSTNRPMEKREKYHYPLSEVTNCNAAAASFVRHGSQEIPIFIIGCVVYLSMVQ